MSKIPLVSVIIVNFNGRNFIGECIESVLNSDYRNFEVIFVDNASTDGSYDFIKDNFGTNKKLQLVRTEKQLFFAGGSNLGVINSKGEKLLFLNSDTVVDKNWVKELVNFCSTHENCLVQPKILSFQNKKTIDNVGGNYNYFGFGSGKGRGEKNNGQHNQDCEVDFVNGTCFMIDRKLFFDLGGFDEWYKYHYEDVDLCLRAKYKGVKSWYCYKSVIYHKGSLTVKSQLNKSDLIFNIRKNRLRTIIKNYNGINRAVKALSLVFVYLAVSLRNFVWLNLGATWLTLRAIMAVINYEIKILIDRHRLWELGNNLKNKQLRLLDVGCGDGTFLNLALKSGFDVQGIDITPRINSHIHQGTVEKYVPKGGFDVITLYHVLEHLHSPNRILGELNKWLKKGGWLVIETPLIGNYTDKFLKGDYFAYYDKTHHSLFTEKELFKMLERSGWEIIKHGFTLYEFPFTVITTAFRKNIVFGFLGLFLFIPLKTLSLVGKNTETIRVYCQKK